MQVAKRMGLAGLSLILAILAATPAAVADAAGDDYKAAVGEYNAAVQGFSQTWQDYNASWELDDIDRVRSQLDAARKLLRRASYHLRKGRRTYGDGFVKQAEQLIEEATGEMAAVRGSPGTEGTAADSAEEEEAGTEEAAPSGGPKIVHAPSGN